MFTIKHILHATPAPSADPALQRPTYLIENLYEAAEVNFCAEEHDMGYLQLRNGETFIAGLFGGMAYVMNDHGKTVARYDIPEQQPPARPVDPEDYPPGHPEAYTTPVDAMGLDARGF